MLAFQAPIRRRSALSGSARRPSSNRPLANALAAGLPISDALRVAYVVEPTPRSAGGAAALTASRMANVRRYESRQEFGAAAYELRLARGRASE